jgi:thiamine-monophosphate kinase
VSDGRRGEFDLIAALFAPLAAGDSRALGLTDDAALLPAKPGYETAVTTDTMVAGVHFLETEAPGLVARRLLRVNLSDLASMGAEPDGYFLNLSVPASTSDAWLEGFAGALGDDQKAFGVALLGGDTTSTPGPTTLSVTMLGSVPAGTAIRRAGASPGDILMVSGTIGDAALGLSDLSAGKADRPYLVARFQTPEPRLALGAALRGIASAMADVSDGLVADTGHICEASGLQAEIVAAAIPLSGDAAAAVAAGETDISALATGGDDYELVFAVPPANREAAFSAGFAAGVDVTEIGLFGAGEGVTLRGPDGRLLEMAKAGYRHF